MNRIFTLSAALLVAASSFAQTYNLFPSADGWLWFNNPDTISKYVGKINETDYRADNSAAAKLVQLVYADQMPDYPESIADPNIPGAGTDGETGSEGSTTGALMLMPSSRSGTLNGGGFVLALPACATLSIDFSCNSRSMIRFLATANAAAPMSNVSPNYALESADGWKVISARFATVFSARPKGRNLWEGIEKLSNGNDQVTIQSEKPIYFWLQSGTADTIYIHGIKVTTPSPITTSIGAVQTENAAASAQLYSLDGRHLGALDPKAQPNQGVYIVRRGTKSQKVAF
ncbi:MAG: T9SS C-terminal target domain-containing protein [Bacteroidaceae bacterium]|nr:T9SS C-terminal target domain-containing protein [Bacteroidaceae bacterium]